MRKVILLFILITSVLGAWADGNVTFTASAPDVVVSGDQFRLTYTVNTHKVRDFRAPNIKGFDVLMGPSRSQQSSTQIINGNVTSTSSITFTYILMADNLHHSWCYYCGRRTKQNFKFRTNQSITA